MGFLSGNPDNAFDCTVLGAGVRVSYLLLINLFVRGNVN